ncbi:apolipoprotein N-acyltransferase [Candidatus Pelagibacter sp.]|nr:apolipoprotein N-acyltransferase [Candidatus Pelagibacter sp.]
MKKNKYFEFLFLVLIGALSSLSLPPYNYVFINFITFSLFFIYLFKKKKNLVKKNSFLYGWLFGFGYFASNLYWISISLTFDINFKFLIPFVLIIIPAFFAIFYGLVTYFLFLFNNKKLLSNFLLFSLLFGFIEYSRGTILTGFPWNLIVYSFSNNLEILQIIAFIGTYAFNMLCISFFISPAIFILKENRKEIIVCIFFLLFPILLHIIGSLKIKKFESLEIVKNDYVIRAIGSNVALDRFYINVNTSAVLEELIEISNPNLNTKTLFIWPEGIIPNTNQSELNNFKFIFNKKFNENHLLGLGINDYKNQNNETQIYNTFSVYDHNINLIQSYNKIKLVPFGEFLPFENILGKVGLKSLTNNYQSFTSGKSREIIEISKNNFSLKLIPLICYEIIYSGKIFKDSEFDYIINISEDGWFGNSIGPKQHYIHSVFRAIESGKYIIRSANNGIAAIINPVGITIKEVPLGETGYIDFNEKKITHKTYFSTNGNKMFLIITLLYIFLIFSFNRIS